MRNCYVFLRVWEILVLDSLTDIHSYGFLWIPMDSYGFLWIPVDSYGFLWIPMDSCGFLWILWISWLCLVIVHLFEDSLVVKCNGSLWCFAVWAIFVQALNASKFR